MKPIKPLRLDPTDYDGIQAIAAQKYERKGKGTVVPAEVIGQLIDSIVIDKHINGVRDAFIIALLFGTGLRRSEAVNIKFNDIDLNENTVKILGKGQKERIMPLPARVPDLLRDWLAIRGFETGPLLYAINRWGKINTATAMTDKAIDYILKKRFSEMGMSKISPHDMRRSFITYLLDLDVDVITVASLAGHKDINTTRIYAKGQEKRNEKAANLIKF